MDKSLWIADRVPGEVELAIWRSGDGPDGGQDPVICLHGITAQHRAFTTAARLLEGERSLVGVDLRGRGDSDKPDSGYGLEAHASDVVRVLDHLGLDRADIAGHSMGGFVGLQTALTYPERVRSLVLLDGGWPRIEVSPDDMTEEQKEEAAAVQEGLARAFRRLDMVFETPDAYLDFWFPGQDLTMGDLPPDLADYYTYDLGRVEGGYQPKCSSAAAKEDSTWLSERAPTAEQMKGVSCPVALVRPTAGFFPDSDPLIPEETRAVMAETLGLRSEVLLQGANHYTMMWEPFAERWAELLSSDSWFR
ncbi:MAG TPA: alpha/beta hydrolase [Rubrobacteraceae bacterium]|nr:alpha/beta hydrolase [Rubrobacteraceae bacterium]